LETVKDHAGTCRIVTLQITIAAEIGDLPALLEWATVFRVFLLAGAISAKARQQWN